MRRTSRNRRLAGILAPLTAAAATLVLTSVPRIDASEEGRFLVLSPAFEEGGPIPDRFTADGLNLSPPLMWQHLPAATRQLALVVEDLDRGDPGWVHWVIYNLPTRVEELPPGLPRTLTLESPIRADQGANSWATDNIGYRGPEPSAPEGPHRYRFRLYALEANLELPPGLSRDQLLRRLDGHILATADLTGTYDRK